MIVILTAAVMPTAHGPVSVTDPKERLAEYVAALQQWSVACQPQRHDLIVVEMSGFGAENITSAADVTASAVNYTPTSQQLRRGKGAVEAAAIDNVIATVDPGEAVVKITGRLTATNGPRVISSLQGANSICIRMHYTHAWADTRMFAMPANLWHAWFDGLSDEVDDGRGAFLERRMGRRALIALADDVPTCPLPVRPSWTGRSGSTGQRYDRWPRALTVPVMGRLERATHTLLLRKQL